MKEVLFGITRAVFRAVLDNVAEVMARSRRYYVAWYVGSRYVTFVLGIFFLLY